MNSQAETSLAEDAALGVAQETPQAADAPAALGDVAATPTLETAPSSAAPSSAAVLSEPSPEERDRVMLEMVLSLGQDDAYAAAGHWARVFLTHAAVVGVAFAAAGWYYS